jgi:hypothetical protein
MKGYELKYQSNDPNAIQTPIFIDSPSQGIAVYLAAVRGYIQKFPDWLPGARTTNGTAFCH